MIASARVAYLARRAADYGVQTGPVSVDLTRVRQRKRAIVESWREGSQHAIQETPGVDLLFGEASFSGPKSLHVRMNDGGAAGEIGGLAGTHFSFSGYLPDRAEVVDHFAPAVAEQVVQQHPDVALLVPV